MNLSVVKKQFTLFLLLFFFFFSACTKIVTTDIGSGLIPPIDGVNTKEMYLDIVSNNTTDTVTRVGTADDHSLGYIDDPLFGQTTASINVELKPTSFPFSFPVSSAKDSLIADSVVLVLSYKGIWGDSLKPLSFRVYQIPSDGGGVNLSQDSVYKTNFSVAVSGELTENNTPKTVDPTLLNDSVKPYPFMEAAANQLRIRLNKEYCQDLLNLSTNTYSSDSLFDSIGPKSYAIVPVSGNSLLKINLLDTNTKLAIYFRYKDRTTLGKIDTTVRYFRCNQYTCGSTNFITHTRTVQVDTSLPPKSTSSNDSLIYIDGNPGIYAKLQIPGLEALSNRVIHRAEILMEQVTDPTNRDEHYLTPPNIFLAPFSQDSSRRFALPNDIQFGSGFVSNQSSLGCYPFKKTDSATGQSIYAYSFDISRYVQGIITRHEKSYPLILYAPSVRDYIYISETSLVPAFTGVVGSDGTYIPLNAPAFGRVRLGGGGNSIHKMRLHIVYSDL